MKCPNNCSNIILEVSVLIFWGEINIKWKKHDVSPKRTFSLVRENSPCLPHLLTGTPASPAFAPELKPWLFPDLGSAGFWTTPLAFPSLQLAGPSYRTWDLLAYVPTPPQCVCLPVYLHTCTSSSLCVSEGHYHSNFLLHYFLYLLYI